VNKRERFKETKEFSARAKFILKHFEIKVTTKKTLITNALLLLSNFAMAQNKIK